MSKTGNKLIMPTFVKEAKCKIRDTKKRKKINEGPGAGYTVQSTCKITRVNALNPTDIDVVFTGDDYVYASVYFDCDIDIDVTDLNFSSYDYGGTINGVTIGKMSEIGLQMNISIDPDEDVPSDEELLSKITTAKDYYSKHLINRKVFTSIMIGAGYTHVIYDGTLCDGSDDVSSDTYSNSDVEEIIYAVAKLTDESIITEIEDKVSGEDDIVESKVKSAKLKKLNEGPGAGYDVSSNCTIKKVNSLSLEKIDSLKENVTYGIVYVDATFNCDIDLAVSNLEFASYYFGGNVSREVDGKATKISLSMTFEADSMRIDSDFVERKINGAIEDIKSLLVKETFDTKIVYGGGWSHATYDGTIAELSDVYSVDYTGAYHNYYDTEITGADAKITEQDVIDYIDKVVTGDDYYYTYSVVDENGNPLEDFDTKEEAIEFAKNHRGDAVYMYEYRDDINGESDHTNTEIAWEADDEVEESLKLKEDNILVSPEFIKKRDALADYFEVEDEVRYDKDMDIFILPDGRAYFVYTGDEADQKAKEEVINSIDDMGIEAFTPDFQQDIIDNQMVDIDWFDDAMKESYEIYADDIMSEDGEHGNRLFDEMIEEGVISEEDVTEDGELADGIDLDEKKEEFVEKLCNRWDDGAQWCIDNFGEQEFSTVCKENDLYDYDEIAETAVRWDGRGHFISYYDGDELAIGDDLFAYKYEEGWDWDKADSIHESMNEDAKGDEKAKTFKLNGITYKVSKLEDSLGKGGYVARWEDDSDNGLGYNNRGWISFDKKNYVLHNEDSKPIKDFMYVISAHDRQPKKPVNDKLIATTISMFGDDAVDTDGAEINEGASTIKDYVVSIVLPYLDTEKNILDVPINFNKEIAPRGYSVWGNIRGSGFFEGDITYKGHKYPFKVENGKLIIYDRYDLYQAKYVGGKEYTKRAAPKINEDTIKTKDGKWANVGKDGKIDSGKFRTKKEADAQRKAMFAQGYRG